MQTADQIEIAALAARYSDAVNRGKPDECAAVYIDGGVLHGPGIEPVLGRTAIRDFLALVFAKWQWLYQICANGVITVDGERAVSRFAIVEHGRGMDGRGTEFYGFYQDRLLRTPDGWRFAQRTVHTLYFGLCERTGKMHPVPDLEDPWLETSTQSP